MTVEAPNRAEFGYVLAMSMDLNIRVDFGKVKLCEGVLLLGILLAISHKGECMRICACQILASTVVVVLSRVET